LRQPGTTTGNDRLPEPFSVQNPFSSVRDRRTTNEEEKKISEWAVAVPEVEEFARTLLFSNITLHEPD
jgi:CdiI N-terminal domain